MGIVLAVSAVTPGWAENSDFSGQIKKPVREAIDTRQTTQKAEEKWRDERRKLVAVYEQLQQEQKQLQDRKEHLQQEIIAAQDRIAPKEKQLQDIEQISTQITPFLQELAGRLRQRVSGSMPFLTAEREQRITRLTGLMEDPEVSVSEKFRKTMEALLVEAEYGSTIEVYQQTIDVDGAPSLVNVFRLGRISLFYQTLDQKRCGFYDVAATGWRPLPTAFNRCIQTAIEIGAKRRPVELLTLPLGRMAGR
jgi:FtsZ-binding cell division protein ZapB